MHSLIQGHLTLQHISTICSPFFKLCYYIWFLLILTVFCWFLTWIVRGDVRLDFSLSMIKETVLIKETMLLKGGTTSARRLYHQHNPFIQVTVDVTIMSLSQQKTNAARVHLCQIVLNWGSYSLHLNTNDNGERFVNFAAAEKMVVSWNCYPHKEIYRQTWRSLNGKSDNQIDNTVIVKRSASNILDVNSCTGANTDAIHFLVTGKCGCKIA